MGENMEVDDDEESKAMSDDTEDSSDSSDGDSGDQSDAEDDDIGDSEAQKRIAMLQKAVVCDSGIIAQYAT